MSAEYTLIYWPTIPGRGEFVRLALEYTKTPYNDQTDVKEVTKHMSPEFKPQAEGLSGNPAFAPPMLVSNKDKLFVSQTPAILAYLGPKLGLAGEQPNDQFAVQALALTFLDLNNEAHDSHHPIAVSLYYEDQKEESIRRAKDFRENRVPKFLAYAQRCISMNDAPFVYGKKLTYADLVLFQVIDGLQFAYPNLMKKLRGEDSYKDVFSLKDKVGSEPNLKGYLESDRRQPYSMGVFRHYPELDEK